MSQRLVAYNSKVALYPHIERIINQRNERFLAACGNVNQKPETAAPSNHYPVDVASLSQSDGGAVQGGCHEPICRNKM